jgi:Zn-dependent protease with chaperone function
MPKVLIPQRVIALTLALLIAAPASAVSPSVPQLPDPGRTSMSREDQEKLGLQAMAEVYKQMPVVPDSSPVTRHVEQLGKRLQKQIPPQFSWPYQFHVIRQKEINAFALPGGPIFINVGTINAAQDEAQLAGVMAHEMSHVYMQHSAKQATSSKRTIAEILGAAAGVLGGNVLGDLARAGIQFGAGTLLLRYSRADEAQADSVGAIIMYKAGYNPMELANFFEILNKQGGSPPQFLSDHPNPGNRTAAIEKEIRSWPSKNYIADNASFLNAKKQAATIMAYTAQQISDGAKQGRWAKENMQAGSVPESVRETVVAANAGSVGDISFEQVRPSNKFIEMHQSGVSIAYPANWNAASAQNSVTIAPEAGVRQNAIAYGVVLSAVRDSNAGSLDQVAQDLADSLQKSNPGMRQGGDIRSIEVNGTPGRAVDLASNSPIQQNGTPLPERDRLVVVPGPGGEYVYLIFISPERDVAALQPTFQRMLDSVRME